MSFAPSPLALASNRKHRGERKCLLASLALALLVFASASFALLVPGSLALASLALALLVLAPASFALLVPGSFAPASLAPASLALFFVSCAASFLDLPYFHSRS